MTAADATPTGAAGRVAAFLDGYQPGTRWIAMPHPDAAGLDVADLRALLDEHAAATARVTELEAGLTCRSCGTACRPPGPHLCMNCAVYAPPPFDAVRQLASATAPATCVYYDQPGHTPDQKPALAAYERGPDDWPLCPDCAAIVKAAAVELDATEARLAAVCPCGCVPGDCGCGFACPRCSPECPACDRDDDTHETGA